MIRRYRYVVFSAFALQSTIGIAAVFAACSPSTAATPVTTNDAATVPDGGGVGTPIDGLSPELLQQFYAGQAAFYAKLQPADGLGPLYTKSSCGDCHDDATRGPGAATKMAVVTQDGYTPLADQSLLPFGNTEHPEVVTEIPGVHTPVLPPFAAFVDAGPDAGMVSIRVTDRVGPPIFGRGYMEAIEDSEIERMEAVQASRSDAIHGRANRLTFVSQPNPDSTFDKYKTGDTVIGRFGLKARIATLDEFAADALQGDMGITSPMRTTEFPNPDGITDDLKPGIDVSADLVNARAMYVRLLSVPPRNASQDNGKAWFELCNCNVCHAETLHTRADYPIPQLANIDAPIYSDMLLHDMGDNLSDSVAGANEGQAGPRDWRTAPLIGLSFNKTFLHDGRASTIQDAVIQHGGPGSEAAAAVECYFSQLTPDLQQQLIDFLKDL